MNVLPLKQEMMYTEQEEGSEVDISVRTKTLYLFFYYNDDNDNNKAD